MPRSGLIFACRRHHLIPFLFFGGQATGLFALAKMASSGNCGAEVLAQSNVDLFRTSAAQGAEIDEVVELVNRHCRIFFPAPQHSRAQDGLKFINLNDPATHSRFPVTTWHFAIAPDFPGRRSASLFSRKSKRRARLWIFRQAAEYVADPSWADATLINPLGNAYAKALPPQCV